MTQLNGLIPTEMDTEIIPATKQPTLINSQLILQQQLMMIMMAIQMLGPVITLEIIPKV